MPDLEEEVSSCIRWGGGAGRTRAKQALRGKDRSNLCNLANLFYLL